MRRLFAVLTVAGALAAAPARAQSAPLVYCSPDLPWCFAMKYAFTPTIGFYGPANLFTVWLQNLQGSYTSTPFVAHLSEFQLFRDNRFEPDFVAVQADQDQFFTPVGNVEVGTTNFAGLSECADEYNCTGHRYTALGQGIAGCDVDETGPPPVFAIRTCPRDGLDGWARLDFTVSRVEKFTGAPSVGATLDDFGFSVGEEGYIACAFGRAASVICPALPYELTLTPEPATLTLLLLGLVPVVVSLRRRR